VYDAGCAESECQRRRRHRRRRDEPMYRHECVRAVRADRSAGSRYADTRHVARSIHHRSPPRRRARHRVARVETININVTLTTIYTHDRCPRLVSILYGIYYYIIWYYHLCDKIPSRNDNSYDIIILPLSR